MYRFLTIAFLLAMPHALFAAPRAERQEASNPLRPNQVFSDSKAVSHNEPLLMEDEPLLEESLLAGEGSVHEYEDPSCGIDGYAPGTMHRPHRSRWHSPLARLWERTFGHPWFAHPDPNDPGRHRGIGDPLRGTSWRNRPYYLNPFVGGIIGDEILSDQISQDGGVLLGLRFGHDFDHFWGLEARLAFTDVGIAYAGETRTGQSRDVFFDTNLLYYPFGDATWRPYLSIGLGLGSYGYQTFDGRDVQATALAMPLGIGMKYHLSGNWAVRFDVTDNLTFPSGSRSDFMHNVSFTGGVELHFGGRRRHYGPWR